MPGRSGRCLCGAVTYRIAQAGDTFGACHCDLCLHWAGGPMMALTVRPADFSLTSGAESLGWFRSSVQAERGFCRTCGSSLFYRTGAAGAEPESCHVLVGTLEDRAGLTLAREFFADRTRANFGLTSPTRAMDAAEAIAFFSAMAEE